MWPRPQQNQQQRLQQNAGTDPLHNTDQPAPQQLSIFWPLGASPPQQYHQQPQQQYGSQLSDSLGLGSVHTANSLSSASATASLAGGSRVAGAGLGWGGLVVPGGQVVLATTGEQQAGQRLWSQRGSRGQSSFSRGHGRRGGSHGGRSFERADAVINDIIAQVRQLLPGRRAHEVASVGLSQLDSRSVAALVKQLANSNLNHHAWDIFNFLRSSSKPEHQALCDVYLYTAMISLCSNNRDLRTALDLSKEMVQRGVERNVHTFSALINVAIKCGENQVALEIYREMQAAKCQANLVTYNTLIDLFGKTGQWAEAMATLDRMRREGLEPVTRTYNTLMIACNASNQWQEALAVYGQMLEAGQVPNTTTYNALISAYSKAGRLEKVMEVYQQMVAAGCERSVITYSSLISACDKAGRWELALQLFSRMHQDNIRPNTITFNSLISACAQGNQWEQASELFEQMQHQGCAPDVVTYTALISAYERGGQWRRALEAFERMRRHAVPPDHIIYSAIIDALWDTGIKSAQDKAVQLYRGAVQEGRLKHPGTGVGAAGPGGGGGGGVPEVEVVEACLGSLTCGMAMITLLCWLADLRDAVLRSGPACLPDRLVVRFGKGRQRDFGSNNNIRNAAQAWLLVHRSPFRLFHDPVAQPQTQQQLAAAMPGGAGGGGAVPGALPGSSRMEASGGLLGEWLMQEGVGAALAPFAAGGQQQQQQLAELAAGSAGRGAGRPDVYDFSKELAVEVRCNEAYQAVKRFEATHCLSVPHMGQAYLGTRRDLVVTLLKVGASLSVPRELVHDAVLLMDRVMSSQLQLREEAYMAGMLAALMVVGKQALPAGQKLREEDVARVTAIQPARLRATEASLRSALGGDTAAVSARRCLLIYLMRLGLLEVQQSASGAGAGAAGGAGGIPRNNSGQLQLPGGSVEQDALQLLDQALLTHEFLNYRPSVTAAAVLYVSRMRHGQLPLWPTSLALMTGTSDTHTMELVAAINAAQRLVRQ